MPLWYYFVSLTLNQNTFMLPYGRASKDLIPLLTLDRIPYYARGVFIHICVLP